MATLKQIKAAEKIVETRGNVSKAMVEAGYDPTTAKNPKNLTESKGWKELVKKIPDHLLLKVHLEGLKATFTDKFNNKAPDYHARHKYLETSYKLKRYSTDDKDDKTQPVTINIVKITQDGLDRIEVQTKGLSTGNT